MTVPAHVVAAAVLVEAGRVLLVHRHPRRAWYPDCWDLVGGHVETGESPEEAIARECREELGIDIRSPTRTRIRIDDADVAMHAFVVRRWEGRVTNAAPTEHDDLRWFRAEDLAGLTLACPESRDDIVAAMAPGRPPAVDA